MKLCHIEIGTFSLGLKPTSNLYLHSYVSKPTTTRKQKQALPMVGLVPRLRYGKSFAFVELANVIFAFAIFPQVGHKMDDKKMYSNNPSPESGTIDILHCSVFAHFSQCSCLPYSRDDDRASYTIYCNGTVEAVTKPSSSDESDG